MTVSSARKAAFSILLRIERDRAYSSVLLAEYEDRLSEPDRGLCHELVLGVLRKKILLDRQIAVITRNKSLDIEVAIALRLGLYQLGFLQRVPTYSAVNESVELAAVSGKRSAKGFVNAVLRGFMRKPPAIEFENDIERISVSTSHPRWLVERWAARFGIVETEAICVANNTRPPISFRPTPKLAESRSLDGFTTSSVVANCFLANEMSADLRELASRREVYFQDEASQLVTSLFRADDTGRFLDVCAAPGGKTGGFAAARISTGRSAKGMFAGDLRFSRVRSMRESLEGQGVSDVQFVQYDALLALPFPERSFDLILLDAPCSGTGTIRHNPEIRYTVRPEQIVKLRSTQLRILENVSKLVRNGGRLVYSTCSLETDENEDVCSQFLVGSRSFSKVLPAVNVRFHTTDGHARTWPHKDGMDGFFIAEFRLE